MKYCRKLKIFRQRRRRQWIFLTPFGLLTLCLLGFLILNPLLHIKTNDLITYESSPLSCYCSKSSLITFDHGECFFNQIVCYPGFTGNQCEEQIKNETYRSHCPTDVHKTEWTLTKIQQVKNECFQSQIAQQEWNKSCLFLCFYHRLTGIIQVPEIFWHKSLDNELDYWEDNPMAIDDRISEHVEGFNGYRYIPLEIKSVIEIGAGPFTQIQHLITPFRSIKKITLIEPNALNYMKLNNCAYRGGHLRGHPVTIIPQSIEMIIKERRENKMHSNISEYYSVVISINVVEHVSDALEYFRGLYDLLEDDGLLIFHERWYDYPQQGDCVLDSAESLHPIRITKWIIEQFLDQFETIYVNFNRTTRQKRTYCFEQGVYFIGKKLSTCL